MCADPLTLLTIGSTAMGVGGSIAGGYANADAARMAGQVSVANAQTALAEGEGKAALIDQRTGNAIGSARAAAGAGNIDVNSGSPLMNQVISAQQGNTDKQLAIAAGLTGASSSNFQAAQDFQKVGQDQLAGWMGAGTALLNGMGAFRRNAGGVSFGGFY